MNPDGVKQTAKTSRFVDRCYFFFHVSLPVHIIDGDLRTGGGRNPLVRRHDARYGGCLEMVSGRVF